MEHPYSHQNCPKAQTPKSAWQGKYAGVAQKYSKSILGFAVILCFMFCSNLYAQEMTLTGTVSDAAGTGVPGTSVYIKGTTRGTVTDLNGKYQLKVNNNEVIVFQSIGYATQEITFGGQTTLNVVLAEDVQQLKDIVVIGYGTQERVDVTGAITSIKGSDIQNIPTPSFDAALQGRAAGLQVTQSSGIPGSAVRMRIRGQASLSGDSEPLYVLDGVPITTGDLSKRDGSANGTNGNVLADINPNDIESIEVLKDAGATAIYGSRAANGVILITTKRGKSGKTVFNVGYNFGITDVTRRVPFLNATEYLTLLDEAYRNSNDGLPLPADFPLQRGLTPGGVVDAGTNTNWFDQVLRQGTSQEANINASGGTEKTRFYIGATYSKQESFFQDNAFERLSGRINIDNAATDKLNIGTQISITGTTNDQAPALWGTVQSSALPIYPIRNADGSYFGSTLEQGFNTGSNPAAQLENQFITKGLRLFSNVYADYKIVDGLSFRTELGLDILNQFDEILVSPFNRFIFPFDYAQVSSGGEAVALPVVQAGSFEERRLQVFNWNINSFFTYNKTFNDLHRFTFVGGFNAQKSTQRVTGIFTNGNAGFRDPYFDNSVSGLQVFDRNLVNGYPVMGGYNSDLDNTFVFASFFGRLDYKFSDKYLLMLSARADGSSRFGENNRFGFFPAVSAGWVLSSEDFFQNLNLNFLDFLKLRTSYGITGNASIGNFGFLGTFSDAGGYLGTSGLAPSRIANPDLQWERNRNFDLGLEFTMFKGRVSGELGYYNKLSTDLLFLNPIQSSTGYSGVIRNTDIQIRNQGLEFNVTTRNVVGKFTWTTDFNINSNQNRVLSTGGLDIEAFASGLGESRLIEGYPVGQGFMMQSGGVDTNTGRELFISPTGERVALTIENPDWRVPVGKPFPDFFGGINNTLTYQGFELSFLFTFQSGNTVFDNEAKFQIGDIFNNSQRRSVLNRWQSPENPGDGETPGLFLSGAGSGRSLNSDRFMYDASFLRLRTLTLAYNIPATAVQKLGMNSIRVYATAQNLFVFTKFPGWDPEFVNTSNVGNTGQFFRPFGAASDVSQFQQANITFNAAQNPFPQTRVIIFGVNASF